MTGLVDPSVYRVSFFIRRIRAHQVVQLFHACTESAALIDVERHQNLIPRLHLFRHLFIWKKQVFFQSPVQERTDFSNLGNLKHRQSAKRQFRLVGRRNDAVLGILVQEYFDLIPELCVRRHLLLRQKHTRLISLMLRQIDSKFYFFDHF